jgi:hypothetical protein
LSSMVPTINASASGATAGLVFLSADGGGENRRCSNPFASPQMLIAGQTSRRRNQNRTEIQGFSFIIAGDRDGNPHAVNLAAATAVSVSPSVLPTAT